MKSDCTCTSCIGKMCVRSILYRPKCSNKVMTLPPKDYYLIPGNGAKNLLRLICDIDRPVDKQDHIYIQIYVTSTKNYYLIPDNDAKNFLEQNVMKLWVYPFLQIGFIKDFDWS